MIFQDFPINPLCFQKMTKNAQTKRNNWENAKNDMKNSGNPRVFAIFLNLIEKLCYDPFLAPPPIFILLFFFYYSLFPFINFLFSFIISLFFFYSSFINIYYSFINSLLLFIIPLLIFIIPLLIFYFPLLIYFLLARYWFYIGQVLHFLLGGTPHPPFLFYFLSSKI